MEQEKQQIVKEGRADKKAKIGFSMRKNRKNVEGDENLLKPEKISDTDEVVKTMIKKKIFAINKITKFNEKTSQAFSSTLAEIDTLLKPLEKKYPNDQNLKWYRAMYEDLKDDLGKGRKPKLDSSFDKLVVNMNAEIKASGVRELSIEDPNFADIVSKLRACGIEPEKIVVKGSPSAKTVVCLFDIHSWPFIDEYSEKKMKEGSSFKKDSRMEYNLEKVLESQKKIYDSVESAYKSGLVKQIYFEGRNAGEAVKGIFEGKSAHEIDMFREAIETGKVSDKTLDLLIKEEGERTKKPFSAEEKEKYKKGVKEWIENDLWELANFFNLHADEKIPTFLGGLKVGGIEDPLLHTSVTDKLKTIDYRNNDEAAKVLKYRSGANNLFLADNVADQVKKGNEDIVFITLGMGHEDEKSSLPFSRVLAYEDVNVIVVK